MSVGANGGCYTSPIYHVHTGSSSSGGGCYTVSHTDTRKGTCGCTGRHYHGLDANGQPEYWASSCDSCASCQHYKTETYTYYSTGCGKSTSTVVGYKVACGLADGQIIGAHIIYTGYDSLPSANNMVAPVMYSVRQEETVVEETAEVIIEETGEEIETVSEEISELEEIIPDLPDESEETTEEVTQEVTEEIPDTVSGNEIEVDGQSNG